MEVSEDIKVQAYAWRAITDRRDRVRAMKERFYRDLPTDADEVTDRFRAEGREPSDQERAQLEGLLKESNLLREELRRMTGQDPKDAQRAAALALTDPRRASFAAGGGAPFIGQDAEGRPIRMLRPADRFAELYGGLGADSATELGNLIRAMVTGEGFTPEVRASAGSSTTGGGVLLSHPVSATIIDLARAKARVVQAGAISIPMESRELTIARVNSAPSATWRAENKAIPAGDWTFDGVKLNARTLAVFCKTPVELVEDARNLGQLVEQVFSEVIALELDRAALLGTGSAEEPLGVKNTPNVLTLTGIGSPNYDDFIDAVRDVRLQNGEPGAVILSPRDAATLEKIKGTANDHYIAPPPSFANLEKLQTSQIPTNLGGGSNESLAFVGDWSNLWLGIRTSLTIEASRSAGDSTGSAFGNLQVWIRGYLRADVAVVRPKHFNVMSGITA